MNIDNGHLVSAEKMEEFHKQIDNLQAEKEKFEILSLDEAGAIEQKEIEHEANGYVPVPPELNRAAKRKLAGKDEAYVSLTSGGELSKWAAKQRKAKRKIAAESRKKNRR